MMKYLNGEIGRRNRKDGFYWVKIWGEWRIAKFNEYASCWELTGIEDQFNEENFEIIDNKIIEHE